MDDNHFITLLKKGDQDAFRKLVLVLESHEESPCMPIGYPSMMILSLFPPLFFYIMNDRVTIALEDK